MENNTLLAILCVDAVENGVPGGRLYHGDLSREYTFLSMDQFLLISDAILGGDAPGSPAGERESGAVWLPGRIATFKVRILFRQNASWQGSVMWLETRHEENFRSEIELLSMIRQALVPAQKQRMSPSSLKIVK